MAKRQNVRVVPSPEVQGEGSWVKVKALTVDQYNRNQELQRRVREAVQTNDTATITEVEQETRKLFAECILDWDWVDDTDAPLPCPHNNPSVFGVLTMDEMLFIGGLFRNTPEQKKDVTT